MSILSKITRLQNAKTNIQEALADKGVSAAGHGFESFSADIANIPQESSSVGTKTITENGTYDVTNYASAEVNVSSVTLSGDASSSDVLTGKTFYSTSSTQQTGTMTNNGAVSETITTQGGSYTVPAGYHDGNGTVTATISAGSATTPATTVSQSTPSISVNSSGLISVSVAATSIDITPTVNAGYISSGTSGTVTMSASSATSQLSTQEAKTVTPGTSSQTAVASGKYTTGDITVSGDANLVAANIASGVSIFGVTGSFEGGGAEYVGTTSSSLTPSWNTVYQWTNNPTSLTINAPSAPTDSASNIVLKFTTGNSIMMSTSNAFLWMNAAAPAWKANKTYEASIGYDMKAAAPTIAVISF